MRRDEFNNWSVDDQQNYFADRRGKPFPLYQLGALIRVDLLLAQTQLIRVIDWLIMIGRQFSCNLLNVARN